MGGDARTAGEAVSEAVIKAAIESIVSGAVDGDIAFVKGDNEGSVAVALESKIFQSTDIFLSPKSKKLDIFPKEYRT